MTFATSDDISEFINRLKAEIPPVDPDASGGGGGRENAYRIALAVAFAAQNTDWTFEDGLGLAKAMLERLATPEMQNSLVELINELKPVLVQMRSDVLSRQQGAGPSAN